MGWQCGNPELMMHEDSVAMPGLSGDERGKCGRHLAMSPVDTGAEGWHSGYIFAISVWIHLNDVLEWLHYHLEVMISLSLA